jgi:hypothetical protein
MRKTSLVLVLAAACALPIAATACDSPSAVQREAPAIRLECDPHMPAPPSCNDSSIAGGGQIGPGGRYCC